MAKVEGITLYMQPVQDLTVEDRVSRTQFQYTMEDTDAKELATWSAKLVDKLKTLPQIRDIASDQQNNGLQASLVIDRDTASRLGILPAAIDNTLYDAFGQRQVSTIFTQLNQYHVVLEVDPQFQQNPDSLKRSLCEIGYWNASAFVGLLALRDQECDAGHQSPGAVSGGDLVVQSGAGRIAGRCHQGDRGGRTRDWNAPQHSHRVSGHGRSLPEFALDASRG